MTEELKDPAEYDDFAAAIHHNERVTTRRYDSVGTVALETVYETIIHWDEGGGKRSRRELARRIVDLFTAPPQRPAEPVAWRWGYRSITTGEMDWRGYVEIAADPNLRSPAIIMEPLYTAPPQRKPLTEEEIIDLWEGVSDPESPDISMIDFARAIERAYGIGGNA